VVVRPSNAPEEVTVFECNRWLDVKEDDGAIVREITAGGSQMLSSKYTAPLQQLSHLLNNT
jgi:hypothetical protein